MFCLGHYFGGVEVTGGVPTLHGFCDASLQAYAVVVYLRFETPNGHFVAAKPCVAPIGGQTIPRLELLSALLLAKLILNVFSALKPEICIGKLFMFY